MLSRNRNFLLLLGNQVASRIAYNLVTFTLLIWVFQLTGSNSAVALWMVMFFVASFSFSLVAGVAADHFDRRKLIISANLLWGIVILFFIPARHSFVLILLLTLASQALDEFFIPSQNSSVPNLVSRRSLFRANSVFFLATYVAVFIGYFLSGVLFRFFGYPIPFLVAFASIIFGALFTAGLPPLYPTDHALRLGEFFIQLRNKLADQLDFLFHHPRIAANIFLLAFILSSITAVAAIAPGFAEQALKLDARDLSFVVVFPAGVGLLLGTILLSRLGKFWQVWQGVLILSFLILLFAAAPTLRIFFAAHVTRPEYFEQLPFFSLFVATSASLAGFVTATVLVPTVTSLQKLTPPANLGRTYGAIQTLSAVLVAVEVLTFGVISDLFSPVVPLAFMGVGAAAASLWVKFKLKLKS